ncbi:hypothetical protein BKA63DRAFT_605053 [Paraphoma chrysanthemicola]|nr:hypothetical protein BKA63DRAFT_605053 [Paraphoma chrysanthemicola]
MRGNTKLDLLVNSSQYGNCLLMAHDCVINLQQALLDAGMLFHALRVELATDNFHQNPKSAREYHCITMVPLGDIWAQPASSYRFTYFAQGDARLLVWYGMDNTASHSVLEHPESKGDFNYNDQFMSVEDGIAGAIENLAWPSDGYQVWDRKPDNGVYHFAMEDGSGRYVVETARLILGFIQREISLENISYGDWLLQPQNKHLLGRLRDRKGFSMQHGVSHDSNGAMPITVSYVLDLGTPVEKYTKRVTESLELMAELCEVLGMPEGEFSRISKVMLEVYRATEQGAKEGAET